MKYTKIDDEPIYSFYDEAKVKIFSPFVCELTISHNNLPKNHTSNNQNKEFKEPAFKSNYMMAREMKKAREKILSNVMPDDIPYLYYLTLQNAGQTLAEAHEKWDKFANIIKKRLGDHKSIAVFKNLDGNYFIKCILWDPDHRDEFKKIDYDIFSDFWNNGQCFCKRLKDFDSLINVSCSITKSKNNYQNSNEKVPSKISLFVSSEDLKESPTYTNYSKSIIKDMTEKSNYSYRLTNQDFDMTFTRKMYIKVA